MAANRTIELEADQGSLPPSIGLHQAVVVQADYKENKQRDGYNIVIDFEMLTPVEEKGRRVTLWQSTKDTVKWRYTAVLSALGIEIGANNKLKFSTQDLIGRKCQLQITHDDSTGEIRTNVAQVLPLDVNAPAAKTGAASNPIPPMNTEQPTGSGNGKLPF